MYTPTNIINQLCWPMWKYPEDFMKMWLHLAEIFNFVTKKTLLLADKQII